MRLRNFRTPFVALVLTCGLVACGGTASETPEPERPDSWQLKLRNAQRQAQLPPETKELEALPIRNLDEPAPTKSTWGSSKRRTPKPVPAPSATTPEPNSKQPL